MKKRLSIVFFCAILSMVQQLRADEGMWLPMFVQRLNYVDMQKQGLKLTDDELYSINHASLKDAIVHFGGGCTGEVVSNEGLIFTNHHCGYPNIQAHSSIDHDYLTDGFWAMSKSEELPNVGLTVKFLVRIEDVTKNVLSQVNESMTEQQRYDKIKEITKQMESTATEGDKYDARVSSFFNGNEYYLFVYEVFKDVRLVGAPPSSIGKFGADSDNWMWPRHTGDFSVFRVYADKNNNPAEYSKENVPYKPKHYLPISLKGLNPDDFTFIMGYPGTTDRYATSYTIDWTTENQAPALVKVRTKKLDILRADMLANADVRIKYASKYASSANYWKFFQGQTKGLNTLDVENRKANLEKQFAQWITKDPNRNNEYKNVLPSIDNAYKTINQYEIAVRYTNEAIWRGSEIIGFARQFDRFFTDPAAATSDKDRLMKYIPTYFKDYSAATDEKIFGAMLEMYYNDVPKDQQPQIMNDLYKQCKGNWAELAKKVYEKSIFANQQKFEDALNTGSKKGLDKDPVWMLQKAFAAHMQKLNESTADASDQIAKGRRMFVKGIREMQPDTKFYPDANSTMRLTYGSVQDYDPADGVHYQYLTTLKGVMEKENPTSWEFVVPAKLKQLYKTKDYGQYGVNGEMPLAFITNNDITGGNSGSPVINANGELVGIAFDGNWEAMSGNYAFEPALQRTICVDARYVLFIIDKYAGASNLIQELTIRK